MKVPGDCSSFHLSVRLSLEFDFLPVLSVLPDPTKTKIFEGDRINVSREYRGAIDPLIRVALSNGNQLLDVTQTQAKVSHSLTVFSNHSGEFECSVMKGNVVKKRNSIVKVLGELNKKGKTCLCCF